MITILHGENVTTSRDALNAIRNKFKGAEILTLDGKKINPSQVKQALETNSLLSPSRVVVIENLLTCKKSAVQEEIIDYLLSEPLKTELVLWEEKEVSKLTLTKFHSANIEVFKLESALFKFLESLRPGNQKEALILFRSLQKEAPEIIFSMLVRQFRMLLAVRNDVLGGMEELDRLAPWQKERLVKQAKYFTPEELIKIYHKLLEIDIQQKTSQNPFGSAKTLEFFILNL